MNDTKACSNCAGLLSEGVRFCPSCGYPASSEAAKWFDRLCAAVIDVSLLVASCGLLMWIGLKWWVVFPTWFVFIEIGYQLKGSIGKSLVGISVPVKSRFQHYLRETLGKLASLAIFGIGFLMIFSKERLALHDYMAATRVLRIGRAAPLRQAIIGLFLLVGLVTGAYLLVRTDHSDRSSPLLKSAEPSTLNLIVRQMPAVATLYVYDGRSKLIGQGSGFLITSDGVGVTNFHVIKDAFSAEIKLGDGRLFHLLSVRAYEADRDIAIFQLGRKTSVAVEEAKDLPYLSLATEESRIGDRIATVGSPEGLSNSVSDGLVSAIRGKGEKQLLQITAPISPGSSGGPVFNLKGEVVAITSFQLIEGQNLNFAIPAVEVSRLQDERANLSLEQLYWQFHSSSATRIPTQASAVDNSWLTQLPEEYLFACFETDRSRCSSTVNHIKYQPQGNTLLETEQFQDSYLDTDKKFKPSGGRWYVSCPLHQNKNGHWTGKCTYSLLWKEPGKPVETACEFTTSEEITEITREGFVSGISGKIDWTPRNNALDPGCPEDSGKKKEFHLVPKQ